MKTDNASGGGGFRLPKVPIPMHPNVDDTAKPPTKAGSSKE